MYLRDQNGSCSFSSLFFNKKEPLDNVLMFLCWNDNEMQKYEKETLKLLMIV